jgi:hypothetical protein
MTVLSLDLLDESVKLDLLLQMASALNDGGLFAPAKRASLAALETPSACHYGWIARASNRAGVIAIPV